MYGTSMQSLTLAIWGACRSPDGPGFEPLISKALECSSFEVRGTPKEYSILIRKQRRVTSHARGSSAGGGRRGPIRAVWCGRAFSGDSLGQTKRRGRRLTDGIAQQSRRARRLPCRSYCCVCAWETPWSWGPAVSDSEIYRIQYGRFGLWWRTRPSR